MDLPRALVQAEDRERRAFERALHDGVQQDLIALAVNLQLVRQLVATDPVAARSLLNELSGEVQRALDEVRKVAGLAHSPLLDLHGLMPALRSAAAVAAIPTQVDGDVAVTLSSEVAATVYRFCVAALGIVEGDDAGATIAVRTVKQALEFEVGLTGGLLDGRKLDGHGHRINALGGVVEFAPARVAGRLPLSS